TQQIPLLPLEIKSLEGKLIDKSVLSDKPVLLHFWAYWCYPCLTELPSLQNLSETHPELKIVPVHAKFTGEGVAAVVKLWQDNKFSFENFYDENVEVAKKFGVEKLPSTLIFDKNHSLIYRVEGELDWSTSEVSTLLNSL
ncbi:MAG: TlpA family protein disulfide reductase, partial [Pseudobdellovibrionaceae bacterium]